MDIEIIEKANTKWLGKEIKYYASIDSTQEEANMLIKNGIEEIKNGTIIMTDNQTKGIGTKGRCWYCEKNKNITMSIIIFPNCEVGRTNNLTKDIAQCMVNVIMKLYKIKLEIKQPNDLLLNGKKISGILTQCTSVNSFVKSLVIGIGFNVNQTVFTEEIESIATSLKKEYNKDYNREDIISEFLVELEQVIDKLAIKI